MERLCNYFATTKADRRIPGCLVSLYSIGPDAVKIYNSFDLPPEDKRKISKIMEKFDRYAVGETNETYERFIFNSRKQKEDETIDEYVAELRTLAQTCNFCTCLCDSLLRNRVVLGINDANTRKRDEASTTQIKLLGEGTKQEGIHKVVGTENKNKSQGNNDGFQRKSKELYRQKADRERSEIKACNYCGDRHRRGREFCRAYGEICNFCKKSNHFEKQCKMKLRAHAVKAEEFSGADSSDLEYLDSVNVKPETISAVGCDQPKEIYAKMLVNSKPVKFHIDCGATVNVLPLKHVQNKEKIKPTDRVLQMWNKSEISQRGLVD
ncbi:uncharacterized protein LOC114539358 [Dendronephthya gigantea]|uniref:uncharacterized protein LOC114539358 n=1 Tax=Dendronephthya gigantea TaxID=151771 RepID=UPI00106BE49F|nr:uncharacterized protein LOC114539358 [Dendronephthya gigantea]